MLLMYVPLEGARTFVWVRLSVSTATMCKGAHGACQWEFIIGTYVGIHHRHTWFRCKGAGWGANTRSRAYADMSPVFSCCGDASGTEIYKF